MVARDLINLTPWSLRNTFNELDRINQMLSRRSTAGVFPLINLSEDSDNYYVRAELPGIDAGSIDITATGESLAISGERKIASEGSEVKYHRREREAGKFSRMFNLPTIIDSEKVTADFKNGILTITLPKAESAKPRKISIN